MSINLSAHFRALVGAFAFAFPALGLADPIEFKNGDTVLFLGDGYLEGENDHGLLEAAITQKNSSAQLKFRNLSWSGDTPRGESRSYFGPAEEGYQRLKKNLEEVKPTLTLLNFGAAAAGDAALSETDFVKAYERVITSLQKLPNSRIVLLSPIPRQETGRAVEAIAALNARIAQFSKAAAALAASRQLSYVDLAAGLYPFQSSKQTNLTAHGAVLTAAGHRFVTPVVAKALLGTNAPPASPALLAAIKKKNEFCFNQWRPANEIYLFGSRKHEQGNNAVEIPQFNPLIESAEQEIAKAKTAPVLP